MQFLPGKRGYSSSAKVRNFRFMHGVGWFGTGHVAHVTKLKCGVNQTPLLIGPVPGHSEEVGWETCAVGRVPMEPGWLNKVMESKRDIGRTCVPSPAMIPTSHPESDPFVWPPGSQSPLGTWFCAVWPGLPRRWIAVRSVTIPSMKHLKIRQLLG